MRGGMRGAWGRGRRAKGSGRQPGCQKAAFSYVFITRSARRPVAKASTCSYSVIPRSARTTRTGDMSAATKAAVAAMMKLPKQERIDRLVAMSTECISRQEDAAPFLALIQMELEAPDDPPATRPSSAAVADPARAKARSKRRELTAKRNELRAMLAKVDARERTMEPPSAASRAAFAAAAPAPHGAQPHVVAYHGLPDSAYRVPPSSTEPPR